MLPVVMTGFSNVKYRNWMASARVDYLVPAREMAKDGKRKILIKLVECTSKDIQPISIQSISNVAFI